MQIKFHLQSSEYRSSTPSSRYIHPRPRTATLVCFAKKAASAPHSASAALWRFKWNIAATHAAWHVWNGYALLGTHHTREGMNSERAALHRVPHEPEPVRGADVSAFTEARHTRGASVSLIRVHWGDQAADLNRSACTISCLSGYRRLRHHRERSCCAHMGFEFR